MPSTVDKNIWNKRKSKQNRTKENQTKKIKAKQKKTKQRKSKQNKSKTKEIQKQNKSKNKRKIKLVLLPPLPTRMPLGNGSRTGMNGSRGTAHHRAVIYPRPPSSLTARSEAATPAATPRATAAPHRQANLPRSGSLV
jgi:hypothetical protein